LSAIRVVPALPDSPTFLHFARIDQGETMIRRSTKDKSKGAFRELKGKLKQKVGQLTNDPALKAKGLGEKISGKIQKRIGDLERVVEKS
jgi:uncharacterized protein YjbJ (UPF0337 family)